MKQLSPNRRHRSEDGYVLVAVIFMMLILVLSLSVALPKVRADIQRDRDEETMHRGKQYVRAVQLYYRKFNAYPPNLDALVKTNQIRFLRKKYIDPTTGKDEWKPIMWGQNKTPMAMGFFGQPLAAAVGGGIGPGGAGQTGPGMTGTGVGSNAGAGGGIFGNTPSGSTDSGTSASGGQSGTTGTDTSGSQAGGGSTTGGTGTSGTTGTTGSNGSAFGSPSNPTGTGQTFGGGGIIGFSPQSPKQSILILKKKNHYIDWEFLYSPLMDQQTVGGGNTGLIGQPASGTTNPVGSSGFGSTTPTPPATPTTPTTPQQ